MFEGIRFKNKYPLLVPFVDDVKVQKRLLNDQNFFKFYNEHLDMLGRFINNMQTIYGKEILDVCIDVIIDNPKLLENYSGKLMWYIAAFKELNEGIDKVSLIEWNSILQNEFASRNSLDPYVFNEKIKSVALNAIFKEKTIGTPFENFYNIFASIKPYVYKERLYNLYLANGLDNFIFVVNKYHLDVTDYKVFENADDGVFSDDLRNGIGDDLLYLKFVRICLKTTSIGYQTHLKKLLELKNYELLRALLRMPENSFFRVLEDNKNISSVTEIKYRDLVGIIYYTYAGDARLNRDYYNYLYNLTTGENIEEFTKKHEAILDILSVLASENPDSEKLSEIYNAVKETTDEEREAHAKEIEIMNKEMMTLTKKRYTDLIDTGKSIIDKAHEETVQDSKGISHKIKTYTLENDEPFTFLITVMHHLGRSGFDPNMYGRPAHKLTMDDPSNFTKDLSGGSDIISSTLINDRSIGTYTGYLPELAYAFIGVSPDDVLSLSPRDGALSPEEDEITELFPYGRPENPDMFISDTLRSQDKYNEVAIRRKTGGIKRLPNAIICYDEINDLSIKHAEYFNIPIIVINTRTYKYLNGYTDSEKKRR